ncbi:MAG: response regulator [Anaerolineae bacterium]
MARKDVGAISKRRILVVDDEEMVRRFIRLLLERAGYIVFEAENARVALECLPQVEVDLVITDLRMPEMDGLELLRESRELAPDVDFVVLTGYGTAQSAVQAIKLGAVDFVTKPCRLGDLEKKVATYFEESRERGGRTSRLPSQPIQELREILSQSKSLPDSMIEIMDLIRRTFRPTDMEITVFDDQFGSGASVFHDGRCNKGRGFQVTKGEMERLVEAPAPWFLGDGTDQTYDDGSQGRTLTVPFSAKGRAVGALTVTRETVQAPYEIEDAALLLFFASQLGLAMLHARTRRRLLDATQDLEEVSYSDIERWVEDWGIYDQNTWRHAKRVARYARMLGEWLGLLPEELEMLSVAGLLHDVGKLGVDRETLSKEDALTTEEFDEVKLHPAMGSRLLAGLPVFSRVVPAIRHHHERFDGQGYPEGLKAEEIPLGARVIAVVDAYDSMVSDRPYRQGLSIEQAVARLRESAGSQLDAHLVEGWLSLIPFLGIRVQKKG